MTITRRGAARLALLALALPATALGHSYTAGDISIGHPWSRPALQGGTGAGFMPLKNNGTQPDRLLSATSAAARTTELHLGVNDNGVMRMRPVSEIVIPPGETVTLGPGGYHIMLIGLANPLRVGDRVPVTLTFERAGSVQVELAVQAQPPAGTAAGGHNH
ncbi:copper chaperone PCu(A)C [Muricoccus radiodurans]|uniref:copper chaperone PCu(A)C n=1 Tax=Muricoccus radiodurans TaxID=2231721 RepID=UPI003CED3F38